jgi:hypothetical protein
MFALCSALRNSATLVVVLSKKTIAAASKPLIRACRTPGTSSSTPTTTAFARELVQTGMFS